MLRGKFASHRELLLGDGRFFKAGPLRDWNSAVSEVRNDLIAVGAWRRVREARLGFPTFDFPHHFW